MAPRGSTLLALATRVFGAHTAHRVFAPLLADWHQSGGSRRSSVGGVALGVDAGTREDHVCIGWRHAAPGWQALRAIEPVLCDRHGAAAWCPSSDISRPARPEHRTTHRLPDASGCGGGPAVRRAAGRDGLRCVRNGSHDQPAASAAHGADDRGPDRDDDQPGVAGAGGESGVSRDRTRRQGHHRRSAGARRARADIGDLWQARGVDSAVARRELRAKLAIGVAWPLTLAVLGWRLGRHRASRAPARWLSGGSSPR